MTWNPGIVFSSDLTRMTEEEELKLKANIHVLKEHSDYLISIRDFSFNNNKNNNKINSRRIQYIYDYLLKNHIDRKRIQLTKPTKGKKQNNRTNANCVEILLLDHKARPMSLITTIHNELP